MYAFERALRNRVWQLEAVCSPLRSRTLRVVLSQIDLGMGPSMQLLSMEKDSSWGSRKMCPGIVPVSWLWLSCTVSRRDLVGQISSSPPQNLLLDRIRLTRRSSECSDGREPVSLLLLRMRVFMLLSTGRAVCRGSSVRDHHCICEEIDKHAINN